MCPINNDTMKFIADRHVSSLIQRFEKLGEVGVKVKLKHQAEIPRSPVPVLLDKNPGKTRQTTFREQVSDSTNQKTSSDDAHLSRRIDDLEQTFYFDNKIEDNTAEDIAPKPKVKKTVSTVRAKAKAILEKYAHEVISNDVLFDCNTAPQREAHKYENLMHLESATSNVEHWENAVTDYMDDYEDCSHCQNDHDVLENAENISDEFTSEETDQFQEYENINIDNDIYGKLLPMQIPANCSRKDCDDRRSLKTDSSDFEDGASLPLPYRCRKDSVATEVGDEYAFLRQDPDSNWQSTESLNEDGDDDGEYCVLRPGTFERTESEENGAPIFQKVEIKCRRQKEDGSPSSTSLCCYKETTILDANKNPRMTTISKFRVNSDALSTFVNTQKDKKEYIVDELIKTEESYITDLEYVIKNYMEFLSEQHNGCPLRRYKYIFINIEMICEESKQLLENLKSSKYNFDSIGNAFIRHKNLFDRYPVYCKNKKVSQDLITGEYYQTIIDREDVLNDKLGLNSYLLKPIQRLAKYELLLKSLYKCMKNESRDTTKIKDAIQLVQKVARRGNDLIMIESIERNPHSIIDTGEFFLKESFKMVSPKKMDIVLFLFHKMIIFANKCNKDKDTYNYKTYIPMEKLYKTTYDLTIELEDFFMRKKHKDPKYVLEVKDNETKEKWIKRMDEILWEQLHKVKAEAQRDVEVTYKILK